MPTLLLMLLAGCSVLGILASLAWTRWRRSRIGELRFERKTFLTGNELDMYRKLLAACGSDFVVMAQVSMGALIDSRLKSSHPLYWEVRRTFGGKICDFVLCEPAKLQPVLVVELDDKMHDFGRDAKRDSFLSQAGLRTLRLWSRKKPDVPELRRLVLSRCGVLKHTLS